MSLLICTSGLSGCGGFRRACSARFNAVTPVAELCCGLRTWAPRRTALSTTSRWACAPSSSVADFARRMYRSPASVERATGRLPWLMAWAASTMGEPSSWRLMTVSRVTGMRPLAIRSRRTEPGPTLASWSLSPTKINRVWADRAQQPGQERQVDHGGLVDDDGFGRQVQLDFRTTGFRFCLFPLPIEAEQLAVNGVGVAQGSFGQALGGLAGGREQNVGHPTLLDELDQDPHAGRLAHAWTAADDRHLAGERRRDGAPLVGLQDNLVSRLGLGHRRFELVSFEQRRVLAEQLRQALCRQ